MPEVTQPTPIQSANAEEHNFIEYVTQNLPQIQDSVIANILSRNAPVEYLRRYGGVPDKETFKQKLPVTSYEDVLPYITRIANGDTSPILSSHRISEFLTSSGTSGGERKMMPAIEEDAERRLKLYSLQLPIMSQHVAGLETGKGMYFLFVKSEITTPGGLPARPVLTSVYKSSHFINRPPTDLYRNYTSPTETILCPDSDQSIYSQLLSGLIQNREVNRVGAVFASGFIRVIEDLFKYCNLLCEDIRSGTVNPQIITDPSVREAVMRILRPDPDLADFIKTECRKGKEGIILRLWPNTRYVDVIVTGAMSQYIPTLEKYSGNLPLVCTMYASSECYFGVNLNPMCDPSDVAYTLIPTMGYFEFLPFDKDNGIKSHLDLVDLADVELGRKYELVVTTYAGLYRYRVGDILRVAGFKNKAPQFNFICRKNVLLSIDSDKTDEVELHNAVQKATIHLSPFPAELKDYTSYADTTTIPGHYVLFWEVERKGSVPIPLSVYEDCCLTIEESLNSVYRQNRENNAIAALEIRIVGEGTFQKLMDYAVEMGASINQYKMPRCVKSEPAVELLNSRVVASVCSPKCPK